MTEVPEDKMKSLMRAFIKAQEEGDVEKTLSFFTEDAEYVTPMGTFKGQDELRHYFAHTAQTIPDLKITPTGIDIVVDGNKATYEHVIAGTYKGKPCQWLALCAYEFRGEKIQSLRTIFDRLSVVEQAASGWLQQTLVGAIASQTTKGLEQRLTT
jgi:uncharacterized protein (TIGR02246 family)